MKMVEPRKPGAGWVRGILAKDQPQYNPLEVNILIGDESTPVESEWELSAEDLAVLMTGGRLRITLLTFRSPLQPILIEAVPAPVLEATKES